MSDKKKRRKIIRAMQSVYGRLSMAHHIRHLGLSLMVMRLADCDLYYHGNIYNAADDTFLPSHPEYRG